MAETTTAAPAAPAAAAPVAPSGAPIAENGEGYAQAQFTPEQTAAVTHLGELRKQASDPALDRGKRDALMGKMSELSRHAFLGEKSPSWYSDAKPDPRLSDASDHNDMAEIGAPLSESMTADELSQLKFAGTVKGLHPIVSGAVSDFVREFAVPKVIADTILDRAVKHLGATHGEPAFERIETLSSEQEREYYDEASRGYPGGSDALGRLTTEIRDGLKSRGLLERFEKSGLTRTSLAYDARVLHALRLWLQTAPARA